jgi:predicted Zn-dependent protease
MPRPFEIDLHSEYLRADLFVAMGRPTDAARVLERVVAAEPANEAAVGLLARSYFGSAQLARAEDALTRLVELAPANGWARRALARTPERQSRHAEATPTTGWPTPSARTDFPRPVAGLIPDVSGRAR